MRENPEQFNDQKRRFFVRLGLSVREALKLHKKSGLWDRKEGWRNVSDHCLVEVARADVLADKLGLPEDIKKDLKIAAALHDFFKKSEKEILAAGGESWDSSEKAHQEATRQMQKAGFNERVIRLANAVEHGSLAEIESILKKGQLSPEDTACLVLHYIDDYTIGSDWTSPAERTPNGDRINDLDRRMDKNESNPRYTRYNEEAMAYFDGKTAFEAQRQTGHLVEERLAILLGEKTGQVVDAKNLPQSVDIEIQKKIAES